MNNRALPLSSDWCHFWWCCSWSWAGCCCWCTTMIGICCWTTIDRSGSNYSCYCLRRCTVCISRRSCSGCSEGVVCFRLLCIRLCCRFGIELTLFSWWPLSFWCHRKLWFFGCLKNSLGLSRNQSVLHDCLSPMKKSVGRSS